MDRQTLEQSVIVSEPAAQLRNASDRATVEIEPEKLISLMHRLREDKAFSFDLLLDHTAVDYVDQNRFELVYMLYSLEHGHHLIVCTSVSRETPVVPSVSRIWPGSHWQEREVFDLFGILYENHDDLRRLFLDDDWKGYPLRKDYKDDYMLELP
jgi:NADH-quinone oxidoreductase subunit C